MKIIIIGSEGHLGSTLMKMIPGAEGIDRSFENSIDKIIYKYDLAFLAVPSNVSESIINRNKNYSGFVDLSSVKGNMEKYSGKIISIHPLFGPNSYRENKSIIFINDISKNNSLETIETVFNDYNIISMNSAEHDRIMIDLLVKPYIMSYISNYNDPGIWTGSFKKFISVSNIKNDENKDVFLDTIIRNKNSIEIIEEMENKLEDLKILIKNRRG